MRQLPFAHNNHIINLLKDEKIDSYFSGSIFNLKAVFVAGCYNLEIRGTDPFQNP